MLLERAGEQAQLREALEAARRGEGRTVVVEGEAGIGKTALLAWVEREAAGLTVLTACGAELEREYAFGVARQLLGVAPPGHAEEFAALNALFWLAEAAAPAALIVDDAQWADAPSRRFLAFLAHRLDGLALALVVARRTGEPALELDHVAASARVLRPLALSLGAATQLAGDDMLAAACHRATGGNPFLLRALLDDLEHAPIPDRVRRAREAGPDEVRRALLLRLASLPPEATALAHAVAVAGDGVRPADVDRPAAAIDALVGARILTEDLAFVHPVVRHAIYADIPPGTRAALHRHAALTLHAEPERIAAQWLAVPPGDAPEALPPLRAAAETAAARGAPDVAARYLRRALEETPHDPELLLAVGRHEALAGEPAAAEHLEAALARSDDPALRTDAAIALVDVTIAHGHDSANLLAQLAEELEPAHPELALRLDAELALTRSLYGYMPPRLATSLKKAHELTDDSLAARSLLAVASLELVAACGSSDEAARLAERSLGAERELLLGTRALGLAPLALLLLDRLERALELLDEIVRDAQATGAIFAYCIGTTLRSTAHLRLGRLSDAEADARASLMTVADWPARSWAIAALSAVLRERGELEEAAELVAEAGEPPPTMIPCLQFERGQVGLALGHTDAALTAFRAAGEEGERWGLLTPSLIPWRSGAALALGRGREAVELAERELDLARVPVAEAIARRTLGLVGPPENRVAHLQDAVEITAATPAQLEHARSVIDLGAALHRTGRRTAARRTLAEGLDLADSCQATVLGERARGLLVRAGARPRRARLTGVDALTASERRTVEMAADGMTNRDIARALFVTPKTVEAHLTRAYAKLDVRGRDALAAALSPRRAS